MYGYGKSLLSNPDVIGFEQNSLGLDGPVGKYTKAHFKGKLAIITGALGNGDAEGYQQGFLRGLGCKDTGSITQLATLPETCGKATVVASQSGQWDLTQAQQAAAKLLQKYPKLGGMFVENENMAMGVHTAVTKAHRTIFMVSANGTPDGLAAIKAGWLTATVSCSTRAGRH